jgi:signal transduction histidine kinase
VTRRRWVIVGIGIAALVWALGGELVSITHDVPENHFLDAAVGLSFFGAGLVALDRRPGNVIGPLMIAYAAAWFVGNWANLRFPGAPTLVLVTDTIQTVFLVHIVFAYPTGTVHRRMDRTVLWVMYGAAALVSTVAALTFPRLPVWCDCPWNPTFFPNEEIFGGVNWAQERLGVILVPLLLAAVWLRWRGASRAERRMLAPLWAAATILAIVYLIGSVAAPEEDGSFAYLLWELRAVLEIAIPIVFVWGLLSTRLARSAVGDLVVELERPLPPGELRASLAHALDDPSLGLVYALDAGARWIDADGRSVPPPAAIAGPPARAVTLVEREGRSLAALVHDPALDEGLVRGAAAAAGIAIDNERLQAEVRAQLEEVRASRQRIVEAGDRERRRVERNLHDGAQQRLVSLSLAISMLRGRERLDPSTAAGLDEAYAELKLAIRELRELARGIHPAILSEEGLAAAVETLAGRCSVPVDLQVHLDGRLPDPVEASAYFVVSETLTNVAKYADASTARVSIARRNGSLLVEVADDGVGGADLEHGSGLRGLSDRVSAVGGTLHVASDEGRGTTVRAEIPLDG